MTVPVLSCFYTCGGCIYTNIGCIEFICRVWIQNRL